jgi:hypothetical protein
VALTLNAQMVTDIGSRRELFVDRFLIERLQGAELRAQQPVERGPVLQLDRPWEGAFSGYFTVIQEPGRFRMYYRCVPNAKETETPRSPRATPNRRTVSTGPNLSWVNLKYTALERTM